jgi:transposase-like protein
MLGMNMKPKVQNRSTKDDITVSEVPAACCDELAAVEFLERHRWNGHPGCPHCGDTNVYQMQAAGGGREKYYRWRCRGCKQQFSVRTGTVFGDSRVPLRHWCYAFWRASTSKKGVSALEIKRHTGLSYKSALFLLHRIRYAMAPAEAGQLGGTVEVDESYIGGKPRNRAGSNRRGRGTSKQAVVALIERGGGVRTRAIADVSARTLKAAIREHVVASARIMTDEFTSYRGIGPEFAGGHHTVNHKIGEYVRGDVSTNTAESFFALVKRGMHGIYHAVSKKHLHRYLAHAEFLWNNRELEDGEGLIATIKATENKKLYYKDPVTC